MIKILADIGMYSAWTIGIGQTMMDLLNDRGIEMGGMYFLLALSALIYGIIRSVNAILDGRVNREQTRLENEKLSLEIWEVVEEEIDENNR